MIINEDNNNLPIKASDKEFLLTSIEWMADHIPGGFFIYKAYGNLELIYTNKSLLNIYSCNSLNEFKELTGFKFKGMVYPEDYKIIQDSINNQIENENNDNLDHVEYRIIRKDGQIRWVDDYGYLAKLPGYGDVYFVFLVDITEKHNKIEEIHKKADIYNKIINQYNELADNSLSVIRLNYTKGVVEQARGKDLYDTDYVGAPINKIREVRLNSLIGEKAKKEYLKIFDINNLIERYYKGEGPATYVGYCRRKSKNPSFVKFTGNAIIDPVTNDIIVFRVETEYNSKKIMEIINQKILLKQFDLVTYIVGDNYSVLIDDSEIVDKGCIFPKSKDGSYSEYIKNQVLPHVLKEDNPNIDIEEALSLTKISEEIEKNDYYSVIVNCSINNQIFNKKFTYYSIDSDSKSFIFLKSDITDLVRKENERSELLSNALHEAESANIAKTSFLSNMSHEIRTPMNAIIGYDSLALASPNLPVEVKEKLLKLGKSAKHLLKIINDILDISSIESGRLTIKKEDFSVKHLIDSVTTLIESQCRDKDIDFNCQLIGAIEEYYIGDELKIKQILINILSNAVKYTNKGGKVKFLIEKVRNYDDNSTIKFTIQDTGVGISKEYLPKIFEPFSKEENNISNKYGSTGLGLAITKNIIELMNGSINVSSEKGRGTTFTINLTLKHSKIPSDFEKNLSANDLKVLVIDDEKVDSEHARLILNELGIDADFSLNGNDAINKIEFQIAKQEPFNLILLDWKMPDMSGVEIARKIREELKDDTAIIILTAYNWEDIVDEATKVGIDSFMSKPLFCSNLIREFDKVITKHKLKKSLKEKVVKLEGRNILVAEDMPINAEILKQILNMRKINVTYAENGKIAVDIFNKSEEYYFDAILMDVKMPVMNGLEATAAIRKLNRKDSKEIPIIALTANAFDDDVKKSLQSGMNAHLTKPIEIDQLYKTLINFIKNRT